MYKYFDMADKWGKGVILHDDWKKVSFSVTGKIAKVTGEEKI